MASAGGGGRLRPGRRARVRCSTAGAGNAGDCHLPRIFDPVTPARNLVCIDIYDVRPAATSRVLAASTSRRRYSGDGAPRRAACKPYAGIVSSLCNRDLQSFMDVSVSRRRAILAAGLPTMSARVRQLLQPDCLPRLLVRFPGIRQIEQQIGSGDWTVRQQHNERTRLQRRRAQSKDSRWMMRRLRCRVESRETE